MEEKMEVTRELLLKILDALDDNCNFFACEGSIFPPLQMTTCRNCASAWEIRMTLCGYNKDEMKQLTELHEREYWRLYLRMESCPHDNISDDDWDDGVSCPDCGNTWNEDERVTTERIILQENKHLHAATDLIVDLEKERGIAHNDIKELLYPS
jgi:hypothetical protein